MGKKTDWRLLIQNFVLPEFKLWLHEQSSLELSKSRVIPVVLFLNIAAVSTKVFLPSNYL
jgi:hypothetical protein